MKALITTGKQYEIKYGDVPIPEIAATEVLVRVKAASICGGDMKLYRTESPLVVPLIPGHEFAGVIERAGGESGHAPGERGMVIPTAYCGVCEHCKSGSINVCEARRVIGGVKPTGSYNGGMAEFAAVPARNFIPIPDALDFASAALVEPLAVCLHAMRLAGGVTSRRVTILGAGPIGLILLILAKREGAASVTITDRKEARGALAESLGADHFYAGGVLPDSAAKTDAVFDAVGTAATLTEAVRHCASGGIVVLLGLAEAVCPLDVKYVIDHEIGLKGSITYTEAEIRECVELLATGAVDLAPLITDRVPLGEGPALFRDMTDNPGGHVKAVFIMTE